MIVVRRALSVMITSTGLAVWGWAHWLSAAITVIALLSLWALVGGITYPMDLHSAREYPNASQREVEMVKHPLRYGPLVWLWRAIVTPWFTKPPEGPKGF